jgi:superfamily II DNA or RNA helicase
MGEKAVIQIIDSIHCRANKVARQLIKSKLKYKKNLFKRKVFGSEIVEKTQHLITGRDGTAGLFLTGLLPKVKSKKIIVIGNNNIEKLSPSTSPHLKSITFREDQLSAINSAKSLQRGIIVAPTGSGKTIIAAGLMSVYSKYRILFLCHTIDLLNQTSDELKKFNMDHFILGGGHKVNWKNIFKKESCILLSTINSLAKVKQDWHTFFDVTIVDEVHHCSKENSQYGEAMLKNLCPVKIGFTATLPSNSYEKLVVEGFFGPVIHELTLKEGKDIGIIAKAAVNLVPVPFDIRIQSKSRTYAEYYHNGIVLNKRRNQLIIKISKKNAEKNSITLIIVDKIAHGKELQKMFKKHKLNVPFVQGEEKSLFRLKIKTGLRNGKEKIAICTKVWKEGINIPELNTIIFACGMKEEKSIKQAMGRGLRTSKIKSKIKLIDFMDPYRYLAEHSVLRYQIYKKLKWVK